MTNELFIDSEVFFKNKLVPVLKRPRYHAIRVRYQMVYTDAQLAGHEFVVSGPKLKPIGFDCWYVRRADNHDPERIADFFLAVATGVLPLPTVCNLIGSYSQYMISTGQRKGFAALASSLAAFRVNDEKTPTRILDEAVADGFAQDAEVKKIMAQRSFDEQWQKKIAASSGRKHLLDQFGKEVQ